MAKTYNSIPTVSTGDVYTAAAHNNIVTNVNNYRVPPMVTVPIPSQSVGTSGSDHALQFSAAVLNPGTEVTVTTGSVSTTYANGGKITVSTAGVYLVTYTVQWAANATGMRRATIALNGTGSAASATGSGWSQNVGTSTGSHTHGATLLMSLAASDYIQVIGNQTSGGALQCCPDAGYVHLAWVGQVS